MIERHRNLDNAYYFASTCFVVKTQYNVLHSDAYKDFSLYYPMGTNANVENRHRADSTFLGWTHNRPCANKNIFFEHVVPFLNG